jgi:hypothetical protein
VNIELSPGLASAAGLAALGRTVAHLREPK